MHVVLLELKDMGCDIDGAMKLFMNKEDFYLRMFKKFLTEPAFEALGEALKTKNTELGFQYAHTLKSVCGNMGMTPLTNEVVAIVEPLRVGDFTNDVLVHYDKLMKHYAKCKEIGKRL